MSTRRGVTTADVPMLVRLTCRLREETHGCGTWDEPGVAKYVREMKTWNFETVVEQILRKATDPDARTPATLITSILSPLPSERSGPGHGRPAPDECPVHPGKWRDNCGLCKVDRYGEDAEPTSKPTRRRGDVPAPAGFKAARAALRGSS